MIAPVLRSGLIVVLAAAAWIGTTALAADRPSQPLDSPLAADLDADGTNETVRARETACFSADATSRPPCSRSEDEFRTLVVEVADTCAAGPGGGGGAAALTLSREMDYVSFARIIDADGDGQPRELAFELRAGASARGVQAKIVSFRPGAGGCVAVRRTLFSYPRADSIGPRPRGASFSTGSLQIRDFAKSRPGLELRTVESYARGSDPGCCPTWERTSYWRLDRAADRYRTYRTKLVRLRRRA
jgi:hypothetical protein